MEITVKEMEELEWDEKSKYKVLANDRDMSEILDAIKFMEHIKLVDVPLFIQRCSFIEHKGVKHYYLQVLDKYFIPFDMENLKKVISECAGQV